MVFTDRQVERFWSRVAKEEISECLLWTGGGGAKGHGNFCFNDTAMTAHRASWIITAGDIPEGMQVFRTCLNKRCVAPGHLRIGRTGSSPHSLAHRLERQTQIDNQTGCIIYIGPKDKCGYGKFNHTVAHRAAWELANGPIPKGMYVCHRCDNPPCVNTDHLFLGTQQDNMSDMVSKGRTGITRHGRGGKHKFDMEQIVRIQSAYATGKVNQEQIAIVLGVDRSVISRIVHRTKYKQQPITATSQTP